MEPLFFFHGEKSKNPVTDCKHQTSFGTPDDSCTTAAQQKKKISDQRRLIKTWFSDQRHHCFNKISPFEILPCDKMTRQPHNFRNDIWTEQPERDNHCWRPNLHTQLIFISISENGAVWRHIKPLHLFNFFSSSRRQDLIEHEPLIQPTTAPTSKLTNKPNNWLLH